MPYLGEKILELMKLVLSSIEFLANPSKYTLAFTFFLFWLFDHIKTCPNDFGRSLVFNTGSEWVTLCLHDLFKLSLDPIMPSMERNLLLLALREKLYFTK